MKKQLLNLFSYFYFPAIAICIIPGKIQSQCAALSLPYSESFSSVSLGASCSWTNSSASSGAGWSIDPTAYAGGTSPEIQAYGNNACAGCVETVSLTMASSLNTTTVTSLQLAFKHKLYVTNQATSGPGTGTLKMQTSANGTSWTDRWTYGYTISGTSLTSITSGAITVPTFNPASNSTYIRFVISGVMFKVWGWQIDDVNASSSITTNIQLLDQDIIINTLYPNPANDQVNLNMSSSLEEEISILLFDYTGRLIKEKEEKLTTGTSVLNLSTNDLSAGVYSLKIICHKTGFSKVSKFVKS